MQGLWAALGLLTILPAPKCQKWPAPKMLFWFPVVGLTLGGLWAGGDYLLGMIFPDALRAALDLTLLVVFTGGLHLDGLADTADGLLAHRGRQEALRIMKDSRIGTWGVLSLLLVLGLKVISLNLLPNAHRISTLLLVPAYGRLAMLMAMRFLPYGRGEEGIAYELWGSDVNWAWLLGTLFLVPLSLLLGWPTALSLIWPSVLLFNGTFFVALAITLAIYRRKMGCATGDMLGALGEICETALLVSQAIRPI